MLKTVDLTRYAIYDSWDFQDVLGLNIFSIEYPPGHPLCRHGPCGLYFHRLNNKYILRDSRANLSAGYDGGITFDVE